MRHRLVIGLLAVVLLAASPAGQSPQSPAPQAPTFRTGVGAVRLDVTVIGHDGLPVTDLNRDDFEVREDGAVQRLQLFQPIRLTGEPPAGSDESLTIRSPDHARQQAEREDVRLLVIFVDDYHLRAYPLQDVRVRHELVNFIKTQVKPMDLVGVMGPLTPISDLGLTRDTDALLERVNHIQGRLGGFLPPRSVIEEAQLRLGPAELARVRAQVSISALESLVVHLGGLREGRKSILYVGQGPSLNINSFDLYSTLQEVIVAANRHNVTIHTFDPRQLGEARGPSDASVALSTDTGGRRIGLINEFTRPLRAVMADASVYYLLGYESPATTADGKFHKTSVTVKRNGVRVIARNGYWAPRAEDARKAAAASAAPPIAPDVVEALDLLREQARRIAVADWIGLRPLDGAGTEVTALFETRSSALSPPIGAVQVEVIGVDGAKSQLAPVEAPAGLWTTRFTSAAGRVQLRVTVKNSRHEVIDEWSREVLVPDDGGGRQIGTPIVYRLGSVAQYRALLSGAAMAPSALRLFRRTDRAVVRLPLDPALRAPVDVQLLNRQGIPLKTMTAVTTPSTGEVQVELPLNTLAQADYVLRFTVSGRGRTTRVIPFSLTP